MLIHHLIHPNTCTVYIYLLYVGCGHCKQLAPTWDLLSEKLAEEEHAHQGIVVAKVDMTVNPDIQNRFDIQGYPTLKLITGGKMYTYEGPRTLTDLMDFALGGYTNAATNESVPADISKWKKWIQNMTLKMEKYQIIRETLIDFEHILDYRKNAAVVLFLLGSFLGFVLGYAFVSFTIPSPSTKTKKD